MITTSIEQTMQAQHLAVRERLGMGVTVPRAIPLRIIPPARPEPLQRDLVTSATVINSDATWRQIIKEVMEKYNVSMSDFMGSGRKRNYILARREAAWRLLTERSMTCAAIARRLGYEDHSSIINLIDGYEKEHGGTRRNSKVVAKKMREMRNIDIMDRLKAGAFVADLAQEYGITPTRIRSVAHTMGFIFSEGADARKDALMEALRQKNRAERQAKFEAQKERAMRNKEERDMVQGLADKYFTVSEAAEAEGIPNSTLRYKAKRHGIVFRGSAKGIVKSTARRAKSKLDWVVEAPEVEG